MLSCLLMLLTFICTPKLYADTTLPTAPLVTISSETDGDHAAGCKHSHSGSCYSNGSHTNSCYGNHATGKTDTVVSGCPSCTYTTANGQLMIPGTITTNRSWCAYCGTYLYHSGSCDNCSYSSSATHASGVCKSNLQCNSSHSYLSCSKGTYGNCQLPTLTGATPSISDWTNHPDQTITVTGSNIATLTSPTLAIANKEITATDNGSYTITATSTSGHTKSYTLTVLSFDRKQPNTPNYDLN